MKNLKRILALVLCLAMVMGLAVSAGATSFTDDADISEDNATAVEVLTALGIINGYEDGSFQPTETVTRAEVAKMIAVAFNGGDESINSLYANVVCGLTDIGGTWAEGYIKYCYATGIIDGYPDGTFLPDGEITGLELCQIMLNILNYEVTWDSDTPWATAIMAKSSQIGLLKNVSTAVGSAITRQEAAQVIFNALTLPIQGYNALGVRVDSDDTILSLYLGGEVDDIVIVANEYASLTDDEPADAGTIETEDGDIYDWGYEGIEQSLYTIGEAYEAWIVGDEVIYAEQISTSEEITEGYSRPLKKVTSYSLNDDTEYYIDFGETVPETVAVVKIVIDGYDDDIDTTIAAGDEIDDDELEAIEAILDGEDGTLYIKGYDNNDNKVDGYLYEGDISYSRFLKLYTEDGEDATVTVSDFAALANGDYLKVIDTDDDGYAEYALMITYTAVVIDDIASNGTYTVSIIDEDTDELLEIDADDLSSEDDLDEGDVVIYTLIDGVYYANLAATTTFTIDDIDYSDEELTTDEDVTYGQTGIEIDEDEFEESYGSSLIFDIVDAEEDYEYDAYLDNYGYVVALTLSDSTNGYGLLTDAYYYTNGRSSGAVTEVEMYAGTDEAADYTVNTKAATSDASYFVNGSYNASNVGDDNGTWGRLIGFGGYYLSGTTTVYSGYQFVDIDTVDVDDDGYGDSAFATNIALYAGDEDSLIISDATCYDDDLLQGQIVDDDDDGATVEKLNTKKYTVYSDASGDTTSVYATADTLYYYVEKNQYGIVTDVLVYTGYANYGDVDLSNAVGYDNIAYTVAYESGGIYYADVIVIEATVISTNVVFVTSIDSKATYSRYYLTGIFVEDDEPDTGVAVTGLSSVDDDELLEFYVVSGKTASIIDENWEDYDIYTGTVDAVVNDYVYITCTSDGDDIYYDEDEVTVYTIGINSKGVYTIGTTDAEAGDYLIYVTDGSTTSPSVVYAIDVTQSTKVDLSGLYEDIAGLTVAPAATTTVKITCEVTTTYNVTYTDGVNVHTALNLNVGDQFEFDDVDTVYTLTYVNGKLAVTYEDDYDNTLVLETASIVTVYTYADKYTFYLADTDGTWYVKVPTEDNDYYYVSYKNNGGTYAVDKDDIVFEDGEDTIYVTGTEVAD